MSQTQAIKAIANAIDFICQDLNQLKDEHPELAGSLADNTEIISVMREIFETEFEVQ